MSRYPELGRRARQRFTQNMVFAGLIYECYGACKRDDPYPLTCPKSLSLFWLKICWETKIPFDISCEKIKTLIFKGINSSKNTTIVRYLRNEMLTKDWQTALSFYFGVSLFCFLSATCLQRYLLNTLQPILIRSDHLMHLALNKCFLCLKSSHVSLKLTSHCTETVVQEGFLREGGEFLLNVFSFFRTNFPNLLPFLAPSPWAPLAGLKNYLVGTSGTLTKRPVLRLVCWKQ